jgi:hypothetical protein
VNETWDFKYDSETKHLNDWRIHYPLSPFPAETPMFLFHSVSTSCTATELWYSFVRTHRSCSGCPGFSFSSRMPCCPDRNLLWFFLPDVQHVLRQATVTSTPFPIPQLTISFHGTVYDLCDWIRVVDKNYSNAGRNEPCYGSGQSMWELSTKCYWDRVFSEYLSFPLLTLFHQCSILIHLSPALYNASCWQRH